MILCGVFWKILSMVVIYLLLLGFLKITASSDVSNVTQATTEYICEHEFLNVTCEFFGAKNYSIHIKRAFFGRLDNSTCKREERYPYSSAELNCSKETSLEIVRRKCENKAHCKLHAHNNQFGGDPCPGPNKYLRVTYQCVPAPFCPMDKWMGVQWNETQSNSTAEGFCPNDNSLKTAYRDCGQAQWDDYVDLRQCLNRTESIDLLKMFKNLTVNFSETIVEILMHKVENLTRATNLDGGELSLLTQVMMETINMISSNSPNITNSAAEKIRVLILHSTSNLLSERARDTWSNLSDIDQAETATRLLAVNEDSSALLVNSIDGPRTIWRNFSGIVVQVDVVNVSQVSTLSRDSLFFNESSEEGGSQFQISIQDIKKRASQGLGRVTFALYDNIGQWLYNSVAEDDNNATAPFVNTKIISASIITKDKRSTMEQMADGVQFTLNHKQPKSNDFKATCVFWNYSRHNFHGQWSDEGCYTVASDSNKTTCKCNHLTNFAVLMSVTDYQMSDVDRLVLSVITYSGCAISIVCLFLAFLTFSSFRNLQCDRNTIHKNLVLCLLISEIIFIVGIERTEYETWKICSVIAGLLHYFFLASFTWMLMEGVHLYILLVEVFKAEKPRAKFFYLTGYGLPVIVVSVSVAVYRGNYKPHENYCWLEPGLIWTFVGPVLAIILANSVMLGVAIYTMCKHASKAPSWKMKGRSKLKAAGSWLRGAAILIVLLGTTWIFCVFYVNEHTVFMAYIFTVLNSLQGLFIFIFHCALNDKVRKEYRRAIQRCSCLPGNPKASHGRGSRAISKPSKSSETMKTTLHVSSSCESAPLTDSSGIGSETDLETKTRFHFAFSYMNPSPTHPLNLCPRSLPISTALVPISYPFPQSQNLSPHIACRQDTEKSQMGQQFT